MNFIWLQNTNMSVKKNKIFIRNKSDYVQLGMGEILSQKFIIHIFIYFFIIIFCSINVFISISIFKVYVRPTAEWNALYSRMYKSDISHNNIQNV